MVIRRNESINSPDTTSGCTYTAKSINAVCPEGFTYTGLTCYRGPHTIWKKKCAGVCPSGYTNTGCSCLRPAKTYGASEMACSQDRFKRGTRCYLKCLPGYTNDGEFCTNWNCVKQGWETYVRDPVGYGLLYTVCGIQKGLSSIVNSKDGMANAQQCMDLALAGCETTPGDCKAVLECVIRQATKASGSQAHACASAVLNGISLISSLMNPGSSGWLTLDSAVKCVTEQSIACSRAP